MSCEKCGSKCKIEVKLIFSLPEELESRVTKTSLRHKDVEILAASWETMTRICTNPECRYVSNRYGSYNRLKSEYERLKNTYEPNEKSIL